METIWLQRSSHDIPWGFRLVGGREFGMPLTVQRVTPGSVAAAGLGPGDTVLKVGNVMATNLEHNDAQELVKQAGNILQLTIKKGDGTAPSGPLSPGSGYGSQFSAQVNDNSYSAPKGFGTGIPININVSTNSEPRYATTPRNYGSQYQSPMQGTRIEIQRVNPPQQPGDYGGMSYEDDVDTDGPSFPDYTIPYKQQGPVHDTPGGPVNIRGFKPPSESSNYGSKTLPRGMGSYNDRDGIGTAGGPPAYEPTSYNASQSSFTPSNTSFTTGMPFQPSSQKPQPYSNAPQAYSSVSAPQAYNSPPHSYNTPSYTGPMSPQSQSSSTSGFVSSDRKPSPYGNDSGTPSHFYNQSPSGYGSGGSSFDQSSVHGSGSNKYSTLPHTKPSYSVNNNNIYNSAPQPYSAPKPFTPAQSSSFSSSQPPFSPSSGYSGNAYPSSSQPAIRRVSFDQNLSDNGPYSPSTNFSPRPYKSPPPPSNVAPSYSRSTSQHDDYGMAPQPASYSRQSSRSNDPYTAMPYAPPGGPMSPTRPGMYYGDSYDPSDVSAGMDNMNLGSPSYHPPPPAAPAPPPPPPPPPSGPPPPPAPPLGDWNATPYRRQQPPQRQSEDADEQRVSDVLMKSAKAGGPKPFSYGIDLSELKKKIGPPTAPKPRQGQPGYEEYQEAPEMQRRPPRKPAGHVQSDYFIKRDEQDAPRAPKKPAGLVQSDYYLSQDAGPRSEVDESPINIHMGTNPKKQSKSFKVLQWMTETEKDEPDGKKASSEEPVQKPKRSKDPERRHNAEDDEMRFSGLHSKADIPSKAFGLLQKMPMDNRGATQNGQNTLGVGDAEDDVGNYDETSIRYKGKSIPSPSFRVLQTWAEHDPDPNINTAGNRKDDDEEDGLPDTLDNEEMVDKRYKGGTIPSKVFKTLQKSVGDDTPEASADQTRRASTEGGQAHQGTTAPVSEF